MMAKVDVDASHYAKNSQPQYQRAQELLTTLSLKDTADILDVGCGYGNIIAEISKRAPLGKSIGIDSSYAMIRLAQEKYPLSHFPNLEFLQMKAEEINFNHHYFDVITCFSCLLWVREAKKALDLICQCLKPGGSLFILTYLKESAYVTLMEKTLENYPSYLPLSAARTMLSIEDYKSVLESHQLAIDEFRPEWRFSNYSSGDSLKDYIKGWLACYVPLPENIQDSFLSKAIENSSIVNQSKTKGQIVLPYQLLAIRARKPCLAEE